MNILVIGGKGALNKARMEWKNKNATQHIYKYTKYKKDGLGFVISQQDYYLYRRLRSKEEQREVSLESGLPMNDPKVKYEQYSLHPEDERVKNFSEDVFTRAIREGKVMFSKKNMILEKRLFEEFRKYTNAFENCETYDLA